MTKREISAAASAMGKLGNKAKVKKLGREKVAAIARANGRKGGRPSASTLAARRAIAFSAAKNVAALRTLGDE